MSDHEHAEDERVRFTDLEVAPDGMGHALPLYDPDNPGPHEVPAAGVPTHGIEVPRNADGSFGPATIDVDGGPRRPEGHEGDADYGKPGES